RLDVDECADLLVAIQCEARHRRGMRVRAADDARELCAVPRDEPARLFRRLRLRMRDDLIAERLWKRDPLGERDQALTLSWARRAKRRASSLSPAPPAACV